MLFQPLRHIYGFFLIALYYPQLVSALVTFKVDNQTYNYSTQDPFGVKLEAYFSNGILVMPEFDAEAPCTLCYPKAGFIEPYTNIALNGYADASSVIVAVNQLTAERNGCLTVAHVGDAGFQLKQSLAKMNGPSFDAILYLLAPTEGKEPGAPDEVPYTAYAPSFPNGAPPINMALLPSGHFLEEAHNNGTFRAPIIVYLQEERGPWNDVYLSTDYVTFIFSLIVIIIYFLGRASIVLIHLYKLNKLTMKKQLVVFTFTFIASILFMLSLPMNATTIKATWLKQLSNISLIAAFHTCLLLWHSIVISLHTSRILNIIKKALWAAVILGLLSILLARILSIVPYSAASTSLILAAYIIMNFVEAIWILAFAYYVHIFWMKSRNNDLNTSMRSSLIQVAGICLLFIIGIAVGFVGTVMTICKVWREGVDYEIARQVVAQTSITIRIVAMLFIFDTSSDEKNKPNENTQVHRFRDPCVLPVEPVVVHSTHNSDKALMPSFVHVSIPSSTKTL